VKYACIRQHRGEFAVRLMCAPRGDHLALAARQAGEHRESAAHE
jgi:hypothetical protein